MTGDSGWLPEHPDPARPSPARIYDYALGGGNNLAGDRAVFDRLLEIQPNARQMAWSTRAFMRRSVLFMIQRGIRQFLDLGSGIPTVGNVHEIAHKADPTAHVVYVDIDEVALAQSRMLLQDEPRAAVVDADLTWPSEVLDAPETRRLLDFGRPIGLLAVSVGHFVGDEADIETVFDTYRDALAPGSVLAVSHFTADFEQVRAYEMFQTVQAKALNPGRPRAYAEILALFGDFEVVAPGLVPPSMWRPETTPPPCSVPEQDGMWAGVAVKREPTTA
jgi:SAM-dependent methyltransferase